MLLPKSYNGLISVLCTLASTLDKYSLTASMKNLTFASKISFGKPENITVSSTTMKVRRRESGWMTVQVDQIQNSTS